MKLVNKTDFEYGVPPGGKSILKRNFFQPPFLNQGLLREEQAKLVKSDNIKKALETEMRSLTVRMEEIETNTVASSKRTIQKMELRIEELEILLEKEKKTHVETTTMLHKKETSVKALLLQSEEDRKNILILQVQSFFLPFTVSPEDCE